MTKTMKAFKGKQAIALLLVLVMLMSMLPVSVLAASEELFSFGSNGKELAAGTYDVGVELMNGSNITSSSALAAVLVDTAKLTVAEDGSASLALTLTTTLFNNVMTVGLNSLSYYAEHNTSSELTLATDISYDDSNFCIAATIEVVDTTEDGAYINVTYMTTMNSVSYIAINYDTIDFTPAVDDSDDDVGIADGVYTVAIASAVDAAGSTATIAAILPETVIATVADGVITYEMELGSYVNLYYATEVLLCTADNYPNGTAVTVTSVVEGTENITGISFDYEGSTDDLLYLYVYVGSMSLFSRTLEITLDWENAEVYDDSAVEDDSEDDGQAKFGSANVALDAGTYNVDIEILAASKNSSSFTADLFVDTAELTVNEDGSASIKVGFQYAELASISGVSSASDVYYSDTYAMVVNTTTILATDVVKDDAGNLLYATMPITTPSADGMYLLIQVDSVSTTTPCAAWMEINYEGINGAIVPEGDDDTDDDDTEEALADGIYNVPLYIAQYKYVFKDYTSNDDASMSNGALNSYATAYVSGGEITYTLQFKGLIISSLRGHLTELWIYPSDVDEGSTTLNNLSDDYRTEVTDLTYKTDVGLSAVVEPYMEYVSFVYDGEVTDDVYFQVNVDAMATLGSGIQQAVMVFDWDSAVLATNSIKSIEISSTNHKTEYEVGDDIDTTGLTLEVQYYDDDTITVPVTAEMISGFDSSEIAVLPEVTITYEGKTTSYVVEIVEATEDDDVDTDTTFDYDYTVEFSYLKTTADENSSMANYMVTTDVPVKENNDGTYTLAFDFYNYYASTGVTALQDLKYDVDGVWVDLELIDVSGEYADYENAEYYARAYVTVDEIAEITFQAYIIPMPAVYATQSWRATLVAATGIAVSSSDHVTDYYTGDTLDVSGLSIEIVYNNGTTVAVEDFTADMVTGFDNTSVGSQTLTIAYTFEETVFTTTYDIFVTAVATSGATIDKMDEIIETSSELVVENTDSGISAQFSPEAISAITSELENVSSSEIVITLEEVSETTQLTEQQQAVVGDATVFEFTVTVDSEPVTDFGTAEVTITIPYTLKEGENAKGLVIWHIAEDGTVKPIDCTYDAETETITFVTTHFSIYATAYDASLVITEIAVNSTGHKTSYTVGDELDLTGLTIGATKEDGSIETIEVTADMVTGFDSSEATSLSLTITYEDFITKYTVTVTSFSGGSTGGSTGGTTPDTSIADGTYSVPVSVKKYTGVGSYSSSSTASMADDAVVGMAMAKVSGDKITYTIQFQGITFTGLYGHLIELWYYTAEDAADESLDYPQATTVVSTFYDTDMAGGTSEFTEKVSFIYEGSADDVVYIRVHVDAMEGFDQDAVLLFNWDNAVNDGGTSSGGTTTGGTTTDDTEDETDEEVTESTAVAGFADVTVDDWHASAVEYVVEAGLFNGISETEFSPNSQMTRAMVWTVLARLSGEDTDAGDTWYSVGQEWSIENGISDGTDLEGEVTREQLVTMLYRYTDVEAVEIDLTSYEDLENVSDWALDAFAWAVSVGIIQGNTETTLNPLGNATRAEVATILMRFASL